MDRVLFGDYEQLKRFFYLFLLQDPRGAAEAVVTADGMAFVDNLWRDWSPGYDAAEHPILVKDYLREPANLAAAIGYYRASPVPGMSSGLSGADLRYEGENQAAGQQPPQPTHLCTCTRPPMAASGWNWPRAPSSSSPQAPAW